MGELGSHGKSLFPTVFKGLEDDESLGFCGLRPSCQFRDYQIKVDKERNFATAGAIRLVWIYKCFTQFCCCCCLFFCCVVVTASVSLAAAAAVAVTVAAAVFEVVVTVTDDDIADIAVLLLLFSLLLLLLLALLLLHYVVCIIHSPWPHTP